jgi:phospholipid/cholesterol/gamma-HCH transport system substrate-binding protein
LFSSSGGGNREVSPVGRVAAIGAVAVAALAVTIVLLASRDEYTVTASFENASQLVGGEQVVVAGTPVGSVEEVALGPRQTALVTFTVSDDDYAPLPGGTTARIAPMSLAGIANRQVQLALPSGDQAGEEIPDGGTIRLADTQAAVELDQLFNTLDDRTVRNLKKVIRGLEASYDGVGTQANRGFRYLNPFLSASRRLFGELTSDERALERMLVDTSQLSGALASRRDDVSALVHNLNLMMGAIASRKESLSAAVGELPGFMRSFNTTAVNLRAALDDVDPLVDAAKPVAPLLRPFFRELRGASSRLVPTVRDLDRVVRRGGKDNDLVEFTRLQVPLSRIALGPVHRDGTKRGADRPSRPGAFPETERALRDSLPQLAFLRPYTPELVGWFDDFGHSGIYDANGGIGRISTTFNSFSAASPGVPSLFQPPIDPSTVFGSLLDTGNLERCPGANERDPGDGSTPFTEGGRLDCDPSQVPVGP